MLLTVIFALAFSLLAGGMIGMFYSLFIDDDPKGGLICFIVMLSASIPYGIFSWLS